MIDGSGVQQTFADLSNAVAAFDRADAPRRLFKDKLLIAWGATTSERTHPTPQSRMKGRT